LTTFAVPLQAQVGSEPKGFKKKYITYAMTAFFATIAVSIAAPDKESN
jgi:hypothetical protein